MATDLDTSEPGRGYSSPLLQERSNGPGVKCNRNWTYKALVAIATGAILFAALLAIHPGPVESQGDSATVQVVRVIDGNTIEVCCVFGDQMVVRYIGIDSPETHHPMMGVEPFGKEAAEANRKLVDGKTVTLKFDVQQFDDNGNTLAYVYLQDGTFVNARLVEHGYAMVMTVPPNVKHKELFLKLQREAKKAKRGLWK